MAQKLIVDTDCGIDDAFALLLALSDKSLAEVLAVTCCFGNTSLDNVVQNVKRVLTVCKEKNIPVYRGCDGPLIHHETQDYTSNGSCHATDGLGNRGHEFSTGDIIESDVPATVALVQLSLKHPGEITLVAIGPLTNVALAQRLDPQFTGRLKSLVIMGGNYKSVGNVTEVAEFNFHSDPEAADIVLGETICPVTLVPWEATIEFAIDWDMYERLVEVKTPKGEFVKCVSKFMADRGRRKGNKKYYDCDLLAVAALLYPQCVTSSMERSVAVECIGTHSRGLTVLLYPVNPLASKRNKVKITTAFDQEFLNQLRFRMLEH